MQTTNRVKWNEMKWNNKRINKARQRQWKSKLDKRKERKWDVCREGGMATKKYEYKVYLRLWIENRKSNNREQNKNHWKKEIKEQIEKTDFSRKIKRFSFLKFWLKWENNIHSSLFRKNTWIHLTFSSLTFIIKND